MINNTHSLYDPSFTTLQENLKKLKNPFWKTIKKGMDDFTHISFKTHTCKYINKNNAYCISL